MHRFARIPCRPLEFAPWLAALAWISTAGVAFAAERTNLRWAIVTGEELHERGVADLLTAQLSDMGVDLVERDAIVQAAHVRAEQIVNGARGDIDATRHEADEYVVNTLRRLEMELERFLTQVRNGITVLQDEKGQGDQHSE